MLDKYLKFASEPDVSTPSSKGLLNSVNSAIDSCPADKLSKTEKTQLKNAIAAFVTKPNRELSRRFIQRVQKKKWKELKIMVSLSFTHTGVNV
jgi:hypothetical protein